MSNETEVEVFYWHDALPFGFLPLLSLSCLILPHLINTMGFGWLDFLIRGPEMLYHLVVQTLALVGILLSWVWFFHRRSQIPAEQRWTLWIGLMFLILFGSTVLIFANAYIHLYIMKTGPFA